MIRFNSLPYSQKAILCKKVFTQAAAARILSKRWNKDLSKLERKIKMQCEWEFVVWVHVPGHRPIFISKNEFIQHFIDFRIHSASEQNLVLRTDFRTPQFAWIESYKQTGKNIYTLQLLRDGVRCDCHDFSGQEDAIFISAMREYLPSFRPTCKHIYKLLFTINLYSQCEWIENQRWADRWTPQPDPWELEEEETAA